MDGLIFLMLARCSRLALRAPRSLRVVQCAYFETKHPDEMPRDIFEKAYQNMPPSRKEKSEPKFDRRNRYQPQFYEVTEMFLDHVFKSPDDSHGGPMIEDWNCEKDQGKLYHWRDSCDKHGITRIKMQTEKYERHIEIHWEQWFMLAYQHDDVPKREFEFDPIRPVDFLRNRKEAAVIEKLVQQNLPPDETKLRKAAQMPEYSEMQNTYTECHHVGYDIPVEWMMALKSVKWPKSFEPHYADKIDYFEPFRKSNMLDQFRKFSLYHARTHNDNDASHVKNIIAHLRKDSPQKYGKASLSTQQKHKLFDNDNYGEYLYQTKTSHKPY